MFIGCCNGVDGICKCCGCVVGGKVGWVVFMVDDVIDGEIVDGDVGVFDVEWVSCEDVIGWCEISEGVDELCIGLIGVVVDDGDEVFILC